MSMLDPAPQTVNGAHGRLSTFVPAPCVPEAFAPEHPAFQAWRRLWCDGLEPSQIDTLKLTQKSSIYRLNGIGPDSTSVIAKRCLAATAQTERFIYERILPALPLYALRCYGSAADADPSFAWLFIEDAGNEAYCSELALHRAVASRWLAVLHTASSDDRAVRALPERGPDYYRENLHKARLNLAAGFENPALSARDQAVLHEFHDFCGELEERWGEAENLCAGLPRTLVHGDLKEKNIRMRSSGANLHLLAFDWEIAGWGVPAVDVSKCPCLELYCSEAAKSWEGLKLETVHRLAQLGVLFRSLIATYRTSLELGEPWVDWRVMTLRLYRTRLADATASLGIA